MSSISIQPVRQEDLHTLQSISRETFYETFAASNTEADMQKYLEENLGTERLGAELQHPDSLFYIAWDGAEPIGYLKLNLTTAQTELQDPNAVEIERIYVTSGYQGQKIGQLLYEFAVSVARERHKAYIWLAVWEENHKAIGFYTRQGFVAFDKHIFKLGDDEQKDIMMKKLL
jgi:ribosomal protein S18 acetylase RimI-like enzyme